MSLAAPLPTRVIKLGGSLLEDPHLRSRFAIWLARQIPANNVVVVGGGGLVDALRAIDRAQQLVARHAVGAEPRPVVDRHHRDRRARWRFRGEACRDRVFCLGSVRWLRGDRNAPLSR